MNVEDAGNFVRVFLLCFYFFVLLRYIYCVLLTKP